MQCQDTDIGNVEDMLESDRSQPCYVPFGLLLEFNSQDFHAAFEFHRLAGKAFEEKQHTTRTFSKQEPEDRLF